MRSKKLPVYIVLISVALLSLLWIQYYWISYSVNLQTNEFKNQVKRLLSDVITEVEESYYCVDFFSEINIEKDDTLLLIKSGQIQKDTISIFLRKYWENDSLDGYKSLHLPMDAKINAEMHVQFMVEKCFDSTSGYDEVEQLTINSYRSSVVNPEKFASTFHKKFEKTLKVNNLNVDYQYAIKYSGSDSIFYTFPKHIDFDTTSSFIISEFFHDNNFFQPYYLYLIFPGKIKYVLKNLWVVISGSALAILLLIIFLILVIRNVVQLKNLAELKTDFINNMTHEFKTPISNINLAIDTLENKGLLQGDKNQITSIFNIIREESGRLQNNIDLILQTSFIEKNGIDLRTEKLSINELLDRLVKTIPAEMNGKEIKIDLDLKAVNYYVNADEAHMTNVLYNIIDNAIKYSIDKSEISISTSNLQKKIYIVIEDKGIGMTEAEQKRIFDKFYRVPTGKIHNVKGFGLGLTYVKRVLDNHGGEIHVSSQMNKGSRFEIVLPLYS
ncbi:sensor histidine kinase [Bacteroidota bacterium]